MPKQNKIKSSTKIVRLKLLEHFIYWSSFFNRLRQCCLNLIHYSASSMNFFIPECERHKLFTSTEIFYIESIRSSLPLSVSYLSLEAIWLNFCIQARVRTGIAKPSLAQEQNSHISVLRWKFKIWLATFLRINWGVYVQNFSPLTSKQKEVLEVKDRIFFPFWSRPEIRRWLSTKFGKNLVATLLPMLACKGFSIFVTSLISLVSFLTLWDTLIAVSFDRSTHDLSYRILGLAAKERWFFPWVGAQDVDDQSPVFHLRANTFAAEDPWGHLHSRNVVRHAQRNFDSQKVFITLLFVVKMYASYAKYKYNLP